MPRRNRRIHYSYQELYEAARQMERIAEQLDENTLQELDRLTEVVHAEWEGEASDRYYEIYQQLRKDMGRMPEFLRAYAQVLRQAADQMMEVEELAALH